MHHLAKILTTILVMVLLGPVTPHCQIQDLQYAVTIRSTRTLSYHQVCAGVLLNARCVLTAAHCIVDVDDVQDIAVLGLLDPKGSFDRIHVKEMTIHDQYDPKTMDYDFALLYLSDEFAPTLSYSKLADDKFTNFCMNPKRDVFYVGWEETRNKEKKTEPMKPYCPTVDLVNNDACEKMYQVMFDPTVVLCANSRNKRQPCTGDSGGPLVCKDVVVGLISYGFDCRDPQEHSIYSKVAGGIPFMKNWLQKYGYGIKNVTRDGHIVMEVGSKGARVRARSGVLMCAVIGFRFFQHMIT